MKTGLWHKQGLYALILSLLKKNGSMYGYEITKAVRTQGKGRHLLSEAALYPVLHQLTAAGLLQSEVRMEDGRIRKYYLLAPEKSKKQKKKKAVFTQALDRLTHLLHNRRTVMGNLSIPKINL